MINRDIFQRLDKKLDVSKKQIYNHINKVREVIGTEYPQETAAYLLASSLGIDINKHLSKDELELVRRAGRSHKVVVVEIPLKSTKKQNITRIYQFKDTFKFECPELPAKVMNEAIKMSDVYPYFYIFENSLRQFIINTLNPKYGKEWWKKCVDERIQNNVKGRIKSEDKVPWHGKRNQHPIHYSDISNLSQIIRDNEKDFTERLPNKSIEWLTVMIQIIKESRNIIAHNNPLNQRDINRVKVNLQDWLDVLNKIT